MEVLTRVAEKQGFSAAARLWEVVECLVDAEHRLRDEAVQIARMLNREKT